MELRKHYANAIRALSVDAINKSNSGHPGAPLGMANMAEALWRHYYKHNPSNPDWINRDRFVLSNGHASMLIYSLLHLTGYDLTIEDIKDFRQFHSKTPGHPESDITKGVDLTTGPLGQGISTAVGMALAEKLLAAQFNKPNHNIIDHRTWVFMGDGCPMEGVVQEAISLAGTWNLNKLTVLYDANDISIDGNIKNWFTEDVSARFIACGWNVVGSIDGHDPKSLNQAIDESLKSDKPSLIICKTTIGYGSPNKAGSSSCHGSPFGAEETKLIRKELNWNYAEFEIPQDVYNAWDAKEKGQAVNQAWDKDFENYQKEYPELANDLMRRCQRQLSAKFYADYEQLLNSYLEKQDVLATRVAGKNILDVLAQSLPEMIGGSADLSGSSGVFHKNSKAISPVDFSGNYIHYGVREFGMSCIMNGLSLSKAFIPYASTFLVFSDYAKNAIRLAALAKIQSIWVLSHDSIGVGEDGPTHQPIEQISTLRLTPNVDVWRPCDSFEATIAYKCAIEKNNGPSCMIMSRQDLKPQAHTKEQIVDVEKGAYIVHDCDGQAELIIIATGSELELANQAYQKLTADGRKIRLVSMPCADVFDRQDQAYKDKILPPSIRKRMAIEAAAADFWYKYVGLDGKIIGMTSFGESAPASILFEHFGFSLENVLKQANELL